MKENQNISGKKSFPKTYTGKNSASAGRRKPDVKPASGKAYSGEKKNNAPAAIGRKGTAVGKVSASYKGAAKETFAAASGGKAAGMVSAERKDTDAVSAAAVKLCPAVKKCGGCQYLGVPYEEQLKKKQKMIEELLGECGKVLPIIGMEKPEYYRNKVHHVFGHDKRLGIISGCYEADSHRVVNVENCLLEDRKSQDIIKTIRKLAVSFKIRIYDEDNGYGLLRHVLVRRGFSSGEIMVVLVVTSPVFPGKNNFVRALRAEHPEITTIVLNVNDKDTSMVIGERSIPIYGPGFIKDRLCGCTFRISPESFYQINPVQTEKLYRTAVDYAGLKGTETIIDAYCGVGTIGLTAASKAGNVIGVELNPAAVKDARLNAKENGIRNAKFYAADAAEFMAEMAENGEHADVVFMDPPRSGSTEKFMKAAIELGPSRIVYISCGPDTQKRDLKYFTRHGYKVDQIQPVEMFPFTEHIETIVCLINQNA